MDAKQIKQMIKDSGIKISELAFRESKKYGYLTCYYKLPVKINVLLNEPMRPSWKFFYDFPDDWNDFILKLMKSKIELYKKEWEE